MSTNEPPIQSGAPTAAAANALLFDAWMERAALHERFKTAVTIDALRLWRPIEQRAIERTRTVFDGLKGRSQSTLETQAFRRYEEIHRAAISGIIQRIQAMVDRDLLAFASLESEWTVATVGEILPGIKLGEITQETAQQIVRKHPFNGSPMQEWFDAIDANAQRRMVSAVRQGVLDGDSSEDIARRLSSRSAGNTVFTATQRDLETTVHTAVQHVNNQVRKETFDQMRSSIAGEVWLSTLDASTCVICASLDGKEFPDSSGEQPPIHPRCRCVRTVKIKGFTPTERASEDGPVGGDVKYPDWLRGQSEARQNRVLGKFRADLFRAGKLNDLDPRMLLDANNRPLRKEELNRRLKRRG